MIDLHSHLLPGIDDGAPDLETALEMLRCAQEDGTTHIVCTPHIHAGRYANTPASIQQALQVFREHVQAAGLKVHLACAAEWRFGIELLQLADLSFVGEWQGRQVLLLEFPHGAVPFGADILCQKLLSKGIVPLIAHPERNKEFLRAPGKIATFHAMGCLFQVTAASLTGGFGPYAKDLASRLLVENVVTIMASDAHNLQHRSPVMSPAFAEASRLAGERAAWRLFKDTPWSIAGHLFA